MSSATIPATDGGHATAALLRRPSFSRCQSHLPGADVGQTKRHSRPLRIGPRRALSQERGRPVSLDAPVERGKPQLSMNITGLFRS